MPQTYARRYLPVKYNLFDLLTIDLQRGQVVRLRNGTARNRLGVEAHQPGRIAAAGLGVGFSAGGVEILLLGRLGAAAERDPHDGVPLPDALLPLRAAGIAGDLQEFDHHRSPLDRCGLPHPQREAFSRSGGLDVAWDRGASERRREDGHKGQKSRQGRGDTDCEGRSHAGSLAKPLGRGRPWWDSDADATSAIIPVPAERND